jgi:uncharacterized protein YndB with AHSA1/START domain
MSTQPSTEPASEVVVRRSVQVPLPPERAFALFTERMTEFWPPDHSIGGSAIAQVVVEPAAGGRWFERGVDGSECDWGRVARWNPPGELVLLWQLGADWTFDPALRTEVEVDFTPDGAGGTLVELRHRHLERYGEQAETLRGIFDSPGGWTGILTNFVDRARQVAA